MILYVLHHPYHFEMENLCRVFYPGESLRVEKNTPRRLRGRSTLKGGAIAAVTGVARGRIEAKLFAGRRRLSITRPPGENPELTMARMLFALLRRATGDTPPWGLLTGVRPSKLMLRLRRDGGAPRAEQYFRDALWVSPGKTALAAAVAEAEEPILARTSPRSFSLYASIPFCPSRCSYCSFVSHTIERPSAQKLIPAYAEKLCEEIARTGQIAGALGLRLESAYIGGGTPGILSAQQVGKICGALEGSFGRPGEFTVEAGRPDTLTPEKLRVLRAHGVTRLCVNPQSLDDAVLARAGRRHTAAEFYEAYALAKEAGFALNSDLIAGLPGDTPAGFEGSLRGVIALRPENITVHTLALKRSAALEKIHGAAACAEMLRAASALLPAAGYAPYYMYRQSRSLGNLENVGWSLPGRECRYNVDMMEESHTILACGAGGVTKLKAPGSDYLERVFSLKYPYEYLARFGELLGRKARIKAFYETYNNWALDDRL
ncbi:MAG: coproporphyrinogen dehydrogenase HemZ [Oscillospiraceae bacterium]|jgi:oxygen-independent coproporphyrinogen-3 oxidase|nr:coproporphyrinogen dehydrogenase HemZ [Oscillospiraceae bacterium]